MSLPLTSGNGASRRSLELDSPPTFFFPRENDISALTADRPQIFSTSFAVEAAWVYVAACKGFR
jgi:hypothetical protein